MSSQENLYDHIEESHQVGDWIGSQCDVKTRIKGGIWKHFRTIHLRHLLWPYPKEGCSKGFEQEAILKKQMEAQHGLDSDVKCKSCVKSFSTKVNLKVHHEICKNMEKHYKCALCKTLYKNKAGLKHHLQTAHPAEGEEGGRGVHQFCGMSFRWKQALRLPIQDKHTK